MDDIIIRGGLVVDGSGEPGFRADVAVKDGRIRAIGDLSGEKAARELDASGLVVAPGFFDAHCHSDTTFLLDSSGAAKLYQGVTTEVCGQCGFSPFPALPEHLGEVDPGEGVDQSWYCASFRDFTKKVEDGGWQMGVNLAPLTGHGSLRAGVLGYANRAVTDEELRSMQELLRQDLEAGVWGLSLGLEYSPGCFADQKEFAALGRVLKEYDAFLPAHLRNEGERLPQAIDELLSVGRETGVHVHISHLKLDNYRVHGTAPAIWKRIADARAAGVNVTADMYPYDACCTYLNNRCPKWVLEGGNGAVEQVLAGPRRQEVLDYIRDVYYPNAQRAATCLIQDDAGFWPEIVGHTLQEIADDMLHMDYPEAAAEILTRTHGLANCIFFVISEEDMLYFLQQDIGIGSDGYSYPDDPKKIACLPHPRSFGAIARFLRLAREKQLCSLEEAVRRITSKGAAMLGMTDRGLLKVGYVADITVFDPAEIGDRATYLKPIQLARGVRHVVLGGQVALEDGVQTEIRAGRILRKPRQ